MAHFAKLDDNNVVLDVCVVDNEHLLDENGVEQEQLGIDFLVDWSGGYTNWKQTSYNHNFRGHYASIGGTYDPELDIFVQIKPFDSWVLGEDGVWSPPLPLPDEVNRYHWDESIQNWITEPEE